MLADGPPLDPSAEQARQWVLDELSKSEYHQGRGLLQRFFDWLGSLFDGRSGPGGAVPRVFLLVVALVIAAVIAYAVLRVVRREGRGVDAGRRPTGAIFGEAARSAADYRAEAARALDAQAYDDAVLAGYRAIAAAALERSVLTELPGRTADELAAALAPVFPTHRIALADAAGAFDEVRYGGLRATRGQAEQVMATDRAVAAARPVFAEGLAGASR